MTLNRTTRLALVASVVSLSLLAAFLLGLWLSPTGDVSHAGHAHAAAEAETVWTCSMHPQIRQGEPGQCPICGMDLIPAGRSERGGNGDGVVLSDRARALIGLRTAEVRRQPDAESAVELLGRVEAAESKRRDVTSWIGGRVDRLHVATTGERIRSGQVVATLYSPEVYAAHQDLLVARRQVESLAEGSAASRQAAQAALRAAEQRLRLLGVPEPELADLAEADAPTRSVQIRSPFSGTVLERSVTEGVYVKTGQPLYRTADLGTVWVQLDAYERDLQRLEVGQAVTLESEALPGARFEGSITFMDPTLDPVRRTSRIRVEVDNPTGQLSPGLFMTATVAASTPGMATPLVIPDTAPLFTGRRSVVYVEHNRDGVRSYEPRTVRLGPRVGSSYPVVSGLSAGERVVSRGAFAIDADLQIRGGASMMMRPDDGTASTVEPVLLDPEERAPLRLVVAEYLAVQRALAEDDLPTARAAAAALIPTLDADLPQRAESAWDATRERLRGHAAHVANSEEIEAARGAFEALSAGMEALLATFGNPLDEPVHVAFCPMAMNSEGARWVQQGDTVDNAYFGDAMRRCGEILEEVPAGAFLSPPEPKVVTGSNPHAGHNH